MAAHGSLSSLAFVVLGFRGLVDVLGGGAAIEPQRSSCEDADLTLRDLEAVLVAGAAMAPHESSSSALDGFGVVFGRKELAAEKQGKVSKHS